MPLQDSVTMQSPLITPVIPGLLLVSAQQLAQQVGNSAWNIFDPKYSNSYTQMYTP